MKRLAVPILILLLLLFAGAAWALYVFLRSPPEMAGAPSQEAPAASKAEPSGTNAAERAEAKPPSENETGSFDVARIDPEGISVFAGRAEPGTNIVILSDGEPIGTVQADENGEWTLATEHKFASNDPKLGLRTATEAEMRQSKAKQAVLDEGVEERSGGSDSGKRTAKAVTSDLLKNLEGMVVSARQAQDTEAAAPKVAGPKAELPTVAESKVEEPKVAEPKAEISKVEEPKVEEPKVATGNAASLPATDTVQEERVATVRLAPQIEPKPIAPDARKTVPVPIMFVFNEATFTADGKKAAGLLLEYLQLKHFNKVSLTGHADERGTDQLNMDLSRDRLDTVARFLKDGGFQGELELIPKGESEPFTGVDRSEYDQEELYQLDRRVELIIER